MLEEELGPVGEGGAVHAQLARHEVEVLATKEAQDGLALALALGREAAAIGLGQLVDSCSR